MPRPIRAAGFLAQPLDTVLGAAAAVRALRILLLHGQPLSAPEIARRARIELTNARRVLGRLVADGVLVQHGTGRAILYAVSSTHPLAAPLRQLFLAESERRGAIVRELREAALAQRPAPLALWVYGSVARAEDHAASDLDLAFVSSPNALHRRLEEFRHAIETVSERWAVSPTVIALCPADVARLRRAKTPFWQNLVRDAVPLIGPAPLEFGRARGRQ